MILLTFTLSSFCQDQGCTDKNTSRGLLINTGIGVTQFGEFNVHFESALLFNTQKINISFIADCFTAKKPEDKRYTTVQIGARLNYVVIKQFQTTGLLIFGSYKYVTQGPERPGSLNMWVWDAGLGVLRNIARKRTDNVWIRGDLLYQNTPNGRLFLSLGVQTVL